jgi:hypothetical protein
MQRAVILILFTLFPVPSGIDRAFPEVTGNTFLIHVKSLSGNRALQFHAIADTCLEALKGGHRVIVIFDVDAVKAIKIGSWYGGHTTILDRLAFDDEERKKYAETLGISVSSSPSNHGELFRLLRGKGAEQYANKEAMRYHQITEDGYDTSVVPAGPDTLIDMFNDADVYISY